MLYLERPQNFKPIDVVGCFLEHDGTFLLLHRQDYKAQGNMWGLPGGKVEKEETLEQAMQRELFQESGYQASSEEINFFRTVYVYHLSHVNYHLFSIKIPKKPDIVINSQEHKDFCWATPEESLRLNYIDDLDGCVKLFYKI